MRTEEKFTSKLLVEGNDDQRVVWALCEKYTIPQNFDVIDCEGIERLLQQLPVRFKQSGIHSVGIIVDADTDLFSRWTALKAILEKQGFSLPEAMPSEGLIAANAEGQRAGVWIMPDNKTNGMLEDFMAFLIPTNDQLLPIVYTTLQSLEEQGLNEYHLTHKAKATIHSWLAWQKDPGTPMGLAITKKYLTVNKETCSKFISWIRQMYS